MANPLHIAHSAEIKAEADRQSVSSPSLRDLGLYQEPDSGRQSAVPAPYRQIKKYCLFYWQKQKYVL